MTHFTSNTYQMKREILNFSNKISKNLSRLDRKFTANMVYGMLASNSCLLTDIADRLLEPSKKINTVDRLSRHLAKGTPQKALISYLNQVKKWCPDQPVIHIDDSDVVKPNGYKFESLGGVRDGSKSTTAKNVNEKGYHVTFSAMERAKALFGKATFVMDRGYDDNKMFFKLEKLEQDYVIRLTAKRKLLYHNKWTYATELCNRRKGKVKLPLFNKGKQHEAFLSHVKVRITASRKDIYLVLVYGITKHLVMLATNKEIKSKEDVVQLARLYFSRWRIEEYFRCKKQVFRFENFRVRNLNTIYTLNFYITLCIAFLAHVSMKPETSALKVFVI